jgi:glycosyltransferase involved in cell wall biosynthesis
VSDAAPRVLMLAAQFWPIVGGAETQARRLAAELRRQGACVEVWTGRWDSSWPREAVLDGVPVRRIGTAWPRSLLRVRRWLFMASLLRALLREARRFDVIHVHQVLYPAFVAAVAGWCRGVPCLARISSTGSTSDMRMAAHGGVGIQRAVTRRLLTRIVAVNARAEAECLDAGYRRDQVVRIPNGVAVGPVPPARIERERVTILYLGGLRAEKRVEDILQAWTAGGRPGRLRVAGDGPQRERLEAMAAGSVEFLGEVEDPSALLRDADVFVLASTAEGMSNALLEAMAAGCACVATFVGGNIDLLGPEQAAEPPTGTYFRGSAGLIVSAGDVAALAAALRDLSGDPARRRALGEAAHRRCQEGYAIGDVARTYLDLYRALRVRAS